jgi:SAM-dependent methyltransferase
MDLKELRKNWNRFGEIDPLWAILTEPSRKDGKWETEEFFRTGRKEVAAILRNVQTLLTGFNAAPRSELPPQFRRLSYRLEQKRRALDFGCGVGRLTQALCDYFEECHGVDIASSMIERAKRFNQYGGRCIYHVNDQPDLALFAPKTFDFIYSNIVLQHIEPRFSRLYVAELVRVLAPGGALVFQLPSVPTQPQCSGTVSDRPLPADAFAAELSASVDALIVDSGSEFQLSVRTRNVGRSLWPAGGLPGGSYQILIGDHWLTPDGEMLVRDDRRGYLPKDVAPGEQVEISFGIPARLPPGDYMIEIDLVQEHVAWFADHGSRALRIPVRITKALRQVSDSGANPAVASSDFQPIMEMHGIEQSDVVSLLERCGARVLRIEEDCHAPGWESFRYYATR